MSEPAAGLPARPSVEQLRKRAKELRRDCRAGLDEALQRIRSVDPRLAEPTRLSGLKLSEAQHVVARESGFKSWAALVHHVDSTHPPALRPFEDLAERLARAYTAGDKTAIREINWAHATSYVWDHDPERMRRRLPAWYASSDRRMELALEDARHLVAKQSGMDSWDELVRSLAKSPPRTPAGRGGGAQSPFYTLHLEDRAVDVRGPIRDAEWDTVFEIMRERRLTTLRAPGQITDAALERLPELEEATSLQLGGAELLTYRGLRHLARLPNLRELDLGGWGSEVTDDALRALAGLPSLEAVSLMWARRISDAGVRHLAACERLERVSLMGTYTGDGALLALAGKSRLLHLEAGTGVTSVGLATLHDFPAFRGGAGRQGHLLLDPAPFVKGGLDPLVGLDGLVSLRLINLRDTPPMTAAALRPLLELPGLESLWCDPSDEAMAVVAEMPSLRKLMCQDTRAGDDGWVALSRSTSLEDIWGRRNRGLGGKGFTALAAMASLRSLGVNLANVDEASLSGLPTFPALRELTPIGLRDAGFRHVGACRGLESLTCMYTANIGDAAMEHLAGLHRLRKYYAGDTSITDLGLGVLGGLAALEVVHLWDCPAVTDAGVAALADAPRLRKVILEGMPRVTREVAGVFRPGVHVRVSG